MNEQYMQLAIEIARQAALEDEVPVGAVIVRGGEVIAMAGNRKERDNCAVHHAEILAIQQASRVVGNWYLDDCEMYVTLEPCPMCAGAVVMSRLKAVYYGASDPRTGAMGSVYNLTGDGHLNHQPLVQGGVLAEPCGAMLTNFFRAKRLSRKGE